MALLHIPPASPGPLSCAFHRNPGNQLYNKAHESAYTTYTGASTLCEKHITFVLLHPSLYHDIVKMKECCFIYTA